MTIITKTYRALFGFTSNALWIEYGIGLPSHSVWLIPGTWED